MHTATRLAVPVIDRVRALNPSARAVRVRALRAAERRAAARARRRRRPRRRVRAGPGRAARTGSLTATSRPRDPADHAGRAAPRDRRLPRSRSASRSRRPAAARRDTRRCRCGGDAADRRATPRRAAAASTAAVTARSFRSTTGGSASFPPSRHRGRPRAGRRRRAAHHLRRSGFLQRHPARATRSSSGWHASFPASATTSRSRSSTCCSTPTLLPLLARHRLRVRHERGRIDRRRRAREAREGAHARRLRARRRAVPRRGADAVRRRSSPFTPWTTLGGYCELLQTIERLELVEQVAPIQLAIRLLIPQGSRLLELQDIRALRRRVRSGVADASRGAIRTRAWTRCRQTSRARRRAAVSAPRREVFERVWERGARVPRRLAPRAASPAPRARAVPYLNEPWYC